MCIIIIIIIIIGRDSNFLEPTQFDRWIGYIRAITDSVSFTDIFVSSSTFTVTVVRIATAA